MDVDIDLTVNDEEIKKLTALAIEQACELIGQAAVRYAGDRTICPVDTGRLSNSMTYATKQHSATMSYADDSGKPYTVALSQMPDKGEVIFGTNVEYAPYVEMGTRRSAAQPFLKPAIENHSGEYEKIAEAFLKGE